jgi:ribonuclease Z
LFASGFLACVALVACVGLLSDGSEAEAKASPVKALDDREVYYPGTEDLAPDEMRVTACGTGMPSVRPKQAAACWLVELGNGDKFLFDIGAQSMSRIAAMNIPWTRSSSATSTRTTWATYRSCGRAAAR